MTWLEAMLLVTIAIGIVYLLWVAYLVVAALL